MRAFVIATVVIQLLIIAPPRAAGQDRNMPAGASATPKASAPVDITGYWVALVTEDWRFRMVTPRKGDYQAVPMTEQARKIANAWDPAADEASSDQCKAYGAPAIMRLPARFHISWQDDNTLRVDSDSGMQTRLFHFNSPPSSPGERTRQGYSTAQWQSAALKVVTTNLRSGYLRKNAFPTAKTLLPKSISISHHTRAVVKCWWSPRSSTIRCTCSSHLL
jgi:hypothetical protein